MMHVGMGHEPGYKKYLEVAQKIRNRIVSGVYAEGDRIPTIRGLAKEFGVNPQTVNKATAHLATLGYLRSRQGAGSEVVVPQNDVRQGIYMLIDEHRSRYLDELDDPRNYHAKDIYLSYLIRMSKEGRESRFLVYGQHDERPRDDVATALTDAGGVLVLGSLPPVYSRLLAGRDVPTVFLNRRVPQELKEARAASVLIGLDRLYALADYLVTLGHRRILFVQAEEFERNETYAERLNTVKRAAANWSGQFAVEVEELPFDATNPECVESLKEAIQRGFTAAIGYNDGSALQFYSVVQRAGLPVGSGFSVCGFDDVSTARLATPPLTTVRVDRSRMLHDAFELLNELAQSETAQSYERTLQTELMIRRSALPPSSAPV
jgi:DNA-binding LacI/PurR family transcriptional regulator